VSIFGMLFADIVIVVTWKIGNDVWLYVRRLRAERRVGQRAQQHYEQERAKLFGEVKAERAVFDDKTHGADTEAME